MSTTTSGRSPVTTRRQRATAASTISCARWLAAPTQAIRIEWEPSPIVAGRAGAGTGCGAAAAACDTTVTGAMALRPPDVATMEALPGATARTSPVRDTRATVVSVER